MSRLSDSARTPAIGVDIGGTAIKIGVVQGTKILAERGLETARVGRSPLRLERAVVGVIQEIRRFRGTKRMGVGVGVPGLVDSSSGVVRGCANLPGWNEIPFKQRLQRRLNVPVEVDNDANAMALAEWRFGAGRGARRLVCVTLGTGVGGGLILDGRLYRGRWGAAGEIGHLWVDPKGGPCSCGGRGCLERYVGNREVIRKARKALRAGAASRLRTDLNGRWSELTPEWIDRACEQGDPFARRIWEEAGHRIGLALANVVNLLSPDRVVIGGGIALAGRWLFRPIQRTVRERTMRKLRDVPIVPAVLGPRAGLIGAALLVSER